MADKIRESIIFAKRVKAIANSILFEGNEYDVQWHKNYVKQLNFACDDILRKLND